MTIAFHRHNRRISKEVCAWALGNLSFAIEPGLGDSPSGILGGKKGGVVTF